MELSGAHEHVKAVTTPRFPLWGAAVLIGVAAVTGAVALTRSDAQTHAQIMGSNGPPGPTVERPLAPGATQVSMAQATSTFGSALALPSTSAVQAADVGPVWALSTPGGTWVSITFPSKGVFIDYSRPAPPDPARQLRAATASFPGSDLIQLTGTTPALYLAANDGSGTNSIEFEADGAEINVFANNDEATLEAIAQSILAQQSSSASP